MAIGFGRIEFVKRSKGRNACQLSAYLSRSRIAFEGNCALDPRVYNFSSREKATHHEVVLPKGANENLKLPEVLWNLAEKKEVRKDAQVCIHMVLALPDDREISLEDRIHLTRTFIEKQFPALPAEFVVHPPERTTEEGASVKENNWHAHVLFATRRLKENGCEFEDKKAKDLMPTIRKGRVIEGVDVGKCWKEHQNEFFHSRGLALRVDENGILPQKHLGPVRMRGRAFDLFQEHSKRLDLNQISSIDPENILKGITKTKSLFSQEDVERFLSKHISGEKMKEVREGFWKLGEIVQLRDPDTKKFVPKFTSKTVLREEEQILRLTERIFSKKTREVSHEIRRYHVVGLTKDQHKAYNQVLDGKGISCIQGYAGTGKSHLLKALKGAYEESYLTVRAFAPDSATANVLKEKGFENAENVYRFLFSAKHGYKKFRKGREVWILDEAGKLSNKPLLELLKIAESKGVKLILSGDSKQLPSVERGGVFKSFCERYGSAELSEIKRQKEGYARSMAKDLAQGKVGEALDQLSRNGGLYWSLTKKEAIENLVLRWAQDHRENAEKPLPKDSSLIVAGTNDEVRVLNEMIRIVRKQRGEISQREFGCETAHGKLYISEGDRIEFRKNERELKVTNGLSGVLLKAEKNRFSVAVQEQGKKTRIITFDPKEYHSFQLGYASTCSRAQGRTVQRAYFLHSSHLNRQMAYVGLTRHIKNVYYFVSKEDAYNLSDLKRQALRDGSKATTIEYTHTSKIESEDAFQNRKENLERLKRSQNLSDRIKGKALNFAGHFNTKVSKFLEKIEDRRSNTEFYEIKKEPNQKTVISEVTTNGMVSGQPDQEISPREITKKITEQDRVIATHEKEVRMKSEIFGAKDPSIGKSKIKWEVLSPEKKTLLKSYFSASSKANEFKEIVQAESTETLKNEFPHFKEWQKACSNRNESAYRLKKIISQEEIRASLNKRSVYYIELQARKHEETLKFREEKQAQFEKMRDLEGQLRFQIQPLLSRLFPDGPSSKSSHSFRFRSKGSLSVSHSGAKAGKFYDFENQEGGGMLKLIGRELNLDSKESRLWALEFLGMAHEIKPINHSPKIVHQKDSEWVCFKPSQENPAPPFEEIGKLKFYYKEVTRHPYHDENGNVIHYVARLQDKKKPTRKITPPLSYGYLKESPQTPSWQYRGYKDESGKKTLYNLHHLKQKPLAPVLIVEGEKSADHALKKIPDRGFVCVTWPGGASSVSKTDWSPLFGRKVVVWPDNDQSGFKSADQVCGELKKVCARKVYMAQGDWLFSKLPEKWDLADPLPKGVTPSCLSLELFRSRKDLFQNGVFDLLKMRNAPITEKLAIANLLFHFEKSVVSDLKKDLLNRDPRVHEDTVWNEYHWKGVEFINQKKEIHKLVITNPHINACGEIAKRLAYQVHLHQAKHGALPSISRILEIKKSVENHTKNLEFLEKNPATKEIKDLSIHRSLETVCDPKKSYELDDKKFFQKEVITNVREISKQQDLDLVQKQALEQQKALDMSKGLCK